MWCTGTCPFTETESPSKCLYLWYVEFCREEDQQVTVDESYTRSIWDNLSRGSARGVLPQEGVVSRNVHRNFRRGDNNHRRGSGKRRLIQTKNVSKDDLLPKIVYLP